MTNQPTSPKTENSDDYKRVVEIANLIWNEFIVTCPSLSDIYDASDKRIIINLMASAASRGRISATNDMLGILDDMKTKC